jgi:regulatory protein NPR1
MGVTLLLVTICKRLTREKDCNRKLDMYEEKSKAYLCIDILNQELRARLVELRSMIL